MSPQQTKAAPAGSKPCGARRSGGGVYETSGKKQASILSFFSRQPTPSSADAASKGAARRASSPQEQDDAPAAASVPVSSSALPSDAGAQPGKKGSGAAQKSARRFSEGFAGKRQDADDAEAATPDRAAHATPKESDASQENEEKKRQRVAPEKANGATKPCEDDDPPSEDVRKFKRIRKGVRLSDDEEKVQTPASVRRKRQEEAKRKKGAEESKAKKGAKTEAEEEEDSEEEEDEEEFEASSMSDSSFENESEEDDDSDDDDEEEEEEEDEEEDEEEERRRRRKSAPKKKGKESESEPPSSVKAKAPSSASPSPSTPSPSSGTKLKDLLYSSSATCSPPPARASESRPVSSPAGAAAKPTGSTLSFAAAKEQLDESELRRRLLASPAAQNCHYFRHFVEDYYTYHRQFSFPPWSDPARMRDLAGRKAIDCDAAYDFSTLWIPAPDSQMARTHARPHMTPGMAQYWEIKKQHFDKLILFKIGKFYELVYGDACAAHRILDLKWMGGGGNDAKPHCGFPEQNLHVQARQLIQAGYKVVVVEQMETPKELEKRNSQAGVGAKDKAVRREVCEVYSAGTVRHADMLNSEARYLLVLFFGDEEDDDTQTPSGCGGDRPGDSSVAKGEENGCDEAEGLDEAMGVAAAAEKARVKRLSGLAEAAAVKEEGGAARAGSREGAKSVLKPGFSACLVDVSTCRVALLHMADDPGAWPALRLLLAQTLPVEVVYSPVNIPASVLKLLKYLPSAPQLSPLTAFPDLLAAHAEVDKYVASRLQSLPKAEPGGASHSERASLELCMRLCERWPSLHCALGGLCVYLRGCRLDASVLSICQFEVFRPRDASLLVLDANALRQLEVLQTQEGSAKNSLFSHLNRTVTPFGCRLLRRWVVAPLRNARELRRRLDAVEWLFSHPEAVDVVRKALRACPDVERLSAKICAQGLQGERKAVYFDQFHQKLLNEFLALLDAFLAVERLVDSLRRMLGQDEEGATRVKAEVKADAGDPGKSQLVAAAADATTQTPGRLVELCADREHGGSFPVLAPLVASLKSKIATDADGAKIPAKGVLAAYDETEKEMQEVQQKLAKCLEDLKAAWKMRSLAFVHSKFKYEVECPDTVSKQLLRDYECDITSSRKGFYRIRTPEICDLVAELEDLEQKQKDAFYPFFSVLFNEFYANFAHAFGRAIQIAAELDCLQSLASVVSHHAGGSGQMCRPIILDARNDQPPVLSLKNCRHPVAETLMDNFVPNDIYLNCGSHVDKRTLLLTGPNMGGKSTLLRQTALCVIMAQIGCFVPADSCTLTPVDRIFTRLGAEDFILQGASTFLVELKDVADLMTYGTQHSLAVIDELGRGTSTFDGTAIALASLEHITDKLQCRCLFATHYHLLCYEMQSHPHVVNVHMKAAIDEEHHSLAFLYKLAKGICPKSHGIHVARLAGIEPAILACAEEKSLSLQQEIVRQQRQWRLLGVAKKLAGADAEELRRLFSERRESILEDLAEEEKARREDERALHAENAAEKDVDMEG
ncbi:putative DNA mismatch repair protein MSH6-1 [Besnoitia besnoiti]|uniref:DNA mismatch repair protein n=1 Tax=Besnoitia besnoiti TaxID=94643 RepID=A0A2A9M8T3_BESBE|nr:putative DNA mismatch repair protein MSH6-1 [Besnoitia besnoiti]PFH32037.1 putative DNA mismatch repair protein MSH6-1 [Besnoitia besnoiti]